MFGVYRPIYSDGGQFKRLNGSTWMEWVFGDLRILSVGPTHASIKYPVQTYGRYPRLISPAMTLGGTARHLIPAISKRAYHSYGWYQAMAFALLSSPIAKGTALKCARYHPSIGVGNASGDVDVIISQTRRQRCTFRQREGKNECPVGQDHGSRVRRGCSSAEARMNDVLGGGF
jgi:hypothetical protein